MQPERELLIEEEILIALHGLAGRKDLVVPDELVGVDVDEFCPGAMERGGVEAQDWVGIDRCLHFKEGLMVLLGVVDDLAEEGFVEGRLLALCLEHTNFSL